MALGFIKKSYDSNEAKVIELEISLEDNELLDFDDADNHEQFLDARKRTKKIAFAYFKNCKGNRNCIDGIIIELMLKFGQNNKYKAIIKITFTPLAGDLIDKDGKKVPLISNFTNSKEICIRDLSIITDKKVI